MHNILQIINNQKMKAEETADYHIKSAWHAISRMYNVYAAQYDMTMAIGYVLLNIDRKGTPATKIAPALGLEPRSLTRMLKSLEEDKGWIRREVDADDKRIVKVFLTEQGKIKRDLARQGVIEFNNLVQESIPKEKLKACFETINTISKLVEVVNQGQKAGELAEWNS
jgi:MarR family transcriptional regulator, organic hydroperoxide resistance regulator